MISEYEYNRGVPELECEAEIEWRPHAPLPHLPITFTLYYEMDGSVKLNGAYMTGQEADDDMLGEFTDEQLVHAELACIDDYNYRCDMAEATEADRGDWLMEQKRDEG